jgi:membrane-associated phospholipid phosphatase
MSGQAYSAQAVLSRRRLGPPRWSGGPAGAIGVAALCVAAMALVWAVAGYVPGAHFRDAAVLHDFIMLGSPRIDQVGNFLLHLLEPELFAFWGLALVAFALARSRPRTAVAAVAMMALAPLTSETLKPLLAHPHVVLYHVKIGAASWPSGHSTAALALVLSAVLVAPARLRPLVAVFGAAFAAAVGCFLLILEWHMPSDVLGGFLVAMLWTALAVAVLRAAEHRWPTGRSI